MVIVYPAPSDRMTPGFSIKPEFVALLAELGGGIDCPIDSGAGQD